MPDDRRCDEVLDFWFGTETADAAVIAEKGALWFGGGADVDTAIRAQFSTFHHLAIEGDLDGWLRTPKGRLALIIVVDQFSRNLFRNDARAFAHDATARAWCMRALDAGTQRELRPIERVFLYLPLEHSEALADQERAVALFRQLCVEVAPALRAKFVEFLEYAQRHRDIIARFGRFPHRNAMLGRASTVEELAFLPQPGSSFANHSTG